MALYKYRALTADGKSIEGTHEAESQREIVDILRQSNSIPMEITEASKGKDVGDLAILNKVGMRDISIFCRQFYTMLNAGVTIVNCLDILKVQTESKPLRKIVSEVYDDVVVGSSFTESMMKHEKVFPELLLSMIASGEVSGNLDGIMERMAIHYENEDKINKKIKGAMIYPTILALLSVVVVNVMLIFVLPTFTGMFEDSGAELPLPTQIVMNISDFLRGFWYVIAIVVGLAVYVFIRYYKTEQGRYNIDKLQLKIPVVGTSMKKIATARFSRTLSTLLSSGVPLLDAIEIVGRVVSNRVIQAQLNDTQEELKRGSDLSAPIGRIKEFPPMLTHMVEIGEQSGSIDDILDKTADFYDSEVEAAIEAMTALIEPVMIIFMAIIIGSIVIAMMLPMFEMVNSMDV